MANGTAVVDGTVLISVVVEQTIDDLIVIGFVIDDVTVITAVIDRLVGLRIALRPEQRLGERWKNIAESVAHGFRFANVALRRFEVRVSRALHDLERVVTAHGHPREACGTEAVEGDALPRRGLLVEFGPRHARLQKPAPESAREVPIARKVHDGPLAAAVRVHETSNGKPNSPS